MIIFMIEKFVVYLLHNNNIFKMESYKIGDNIKYMYGDELIEATILDIGNSICKTALIVDDDGGWIFPSQVV